MILSANPAPQSDLDRDLLGTNDPRRLDLNRFWALADFTPARQKYTIRTILRARYSPGGQVQHTYAEISARLGVSETRAHEMVARALRLMRHPARLKQVLR